MAENRDPKPSNPLALMGTLLEDLQAPEIFATTVSSISMTGPNVTLTLTSSRFDNSVTPPVRRQVVVGRIVLPTLPAADLAVTLRDFLVEHGVTFVEKPSTTALRAPAKEHLQ